MSTAGKINRLILKGHTQDWDAWVPDVTDFYQNNVVFTFTTDPTRFGFPHVRISLEMYCCNATNRIDECDESLFACGIVIIKVEFGVRRSRNKPRNWVTTTPGNTAYIDSRFDFIERPFRYYVDDCGERVDSRSDWVDFWAMLNNWANRSGSGVGDNSLTPFLTFDSLTEPPIVCKIDGVRPTGVISWLTP